jgi:hypothetical protein
MQIFSIWKVEVEGKKKRFIQLKEEQTAFGLLLFFFTIEPYRSIFSRKHCFINVT